MQQQYTFWEHMFEHQIVRFAERHQMRNLCGWHMWVSNMCVWLNETSCGIQHTTQHDIARLLCPITIFIDCVKETKANYVAHRTNHNVELDIREPIEHNATGYGWHNKTAHIWHQSYTWANAVSSKDSLEYNGTIIQCADDFWDHASISIIYNMNGGSNHLHPRPKQKTYM